MKPLAIIPACGFGCRMNLAPNQSKEMLPDPFNNNQPLIKWTIDECNNNEIDPLILVRKEKQDLIDYLQQINVKYILLEPGKEWAETVYKSNSYWADENILILPDTRWEPASALYDIKKLLNFGSEVVFAVHEVQDISKWGHVNIVSYTEKPTWAFSNTAWGIIGFTEVAGKDLFKTMQNQNEYYSHQFNTNFTFLDEFKDLTRTGKIE